MSSRLFIGLSLGLFFLALAIPVQFAWPHAYPDKVAPPDGSAVEEPPREVRIQFTEGIEIEFIRIVVKNSAGEIVNLERLRRVAADSLAVDLKPLRPGPYVVEWQVLSVDTHITEGVLRFTVTGGR